MCLSGPVLTYPNCYQSKLEYPGLGELVRMMTAAVVEVDPPGRRFSHLVQTSLVQTFKDAHIEYGLPICPVESFDKAAAASDGRA